MTPQVRTSCQGSVINVVSNTPAEIVKSAMIETRRTPKRCINAAAKGAMKPNRSRLTEMAAEIVARLQPNSSWSGTISTPGVERKPAAPSKVMKTTPATIQA